MERLLLAGLIILANRIEGGLVSSGSGAGSIGCAPSHGVVGSLIELLELLVHLLRVLLQRHGEHVRLLLLLAHILHIRRDHLHAVHIALLVSVSCWLTTRELLGVHLVQEVAKLRLHTVGSTLSIDAHRVRAETWALITLVRVRVLARLEVLAELELAGL